MIPTGKAVIASESAKKVLAEDMRQQAHKLAALKAEAEKKAAALENVALEITAKVSASGVTYGSVTAATVAEELAKKGFDIDRKIVTMRDIKKVGDYEAVVHFHKEVEVKIPVKVVAENAPKEESAAETKKVSELAEEAANAEAPVAETEVTEEAEAPAAENAEEAAE